MSCFVSLQGANIVVDGNSQATDIYTVGERWPLQLAHQFSRAAIAPRQIQNFAVGGQTTVQMTNDAPGQIDSAFDSACYNVLIVQEGRNHMATGATPAEAIATMRSYCIHRRSRGYYVVMIGTLPSNESAFQSSLLEFDRLARLGWKEYADAWCDLRRLVPQIQVGAYLPDGIHPSPSAQCYIAAAIFSVLRSIPLRR